MIKKIVLLALMMVVSVAHAKEFVDSKDIPAGYGVLVVRSTMSPGVGVTFSSRSPASLRSFFGMGELRLDNASPEGYVVQLVPAGDYRWYKMYRGSQYAYSFRDAFSIKPQAVTYGGDVTILTDSHRAGLVVTDQFAEAQAFLRAKYPLLSAAYTMQSGIGNIAAGRSVASADSSTSSAKSETYSGKGGMTAYDVKSNVYEYHYENGFTGEDAVGWDPNLQFAWSRIAAAQACGQKIDQSKAISALDKQYPNDRIVHEMIGIGFHKAQMSKNPKFCTPARIDALKALIPRLEDGTFPKPYPAK